MFSKYVSLMSTTDQVEAARVRDILNAHGIKFRIKTTNSGINTAANIHGVMGGTWNGENRFLTTFQVDSRDAEYAGSLIAK